MSARFRMICAREADILALLGQQGVPVPHIYGFCEDPLAIVMQAVPGTRDISAASDDAERLSLAKQYIDAMGRHAPAATGRLCGQGHRAARGRPKPFR